MTKKRDNWRNRNKRMNRAFFAKDRGFKKWLDRHPDCQRLVRNCIRCAERLAYDDDPLYPQKHGGLDWWYLEMVTEAVSDVAHVSNYEVYYYVLDKAGTDEKTVSRYVSYRYDLERPLCDLARELLFKAVDEGDEDLARLSSEVLKYLDAE